jgi:2-oxoisovalerate dehydrogenase E1 component
MEIEKVHSILSTEKSLLEKWYYLMAMGRIVDDRAPNYLKQAIGWSYHAPYAGHDAIQLAIGQVFERKVDHLFPYYRDMLTTISAGLTPEEIILNGIAKATDLTSGGRHMSNHFSKHEWHIYNVASTVGSHTQHAAGVARGMKKYNKDGVVFCSMGESATSEGFVYESINGATTEKLKVVYVIQDNGYGISVPKSEQTANRKVADNYSGMKNLSILFCNGKDVFDSMNTMIAAKEIAIKEVHPVIVQASCVRIHSHSNSDRHELYRDDYELNYVKEYDPLAKFRRMLLRYKRFTEKELLKIEERAKNEVKEAHRKALAAPDPVAESIFNFVIPDPYVSKKYPDGTHNFQGEPKKLIEALNETLKAEFRLNPDTFLWGQDIANKGKEGVFNVTKGMNKEFGSVRVFNAPIAEDYIVGTANGMSRFDDKIRIVIEGAEFADYFWPAMEQFVTTTHEYWRTNGQFSPNITIRLASGGYIGGGLYHSQTIEGVLLNFPGIRIAYPSYADDAAGLLRTAIRSRGLTLFLEPKALYNSPKAATPVPDDFEVPFGKARIRRPGKDMSIITYGNTTLMSIEVADQIATETGEEIEVLDLRTLAPIDKDAIMATVKKTGKVLVVHEDKITGGAGGEIVAIIAADAFEYLDAPIKRVGSTNTPVGFHKVLERAVLPSNERIYTAAKELLNY